MTDSRSSPGSVRDILSAAVNTLADPCDASDFKGNEAAALRKTIKDALGILKELGATLNDVAATPGDMADYKIGGWLSAALEDPAVCPEMKADINAWFEAHQPGLLMCCTCGGEIGQPAEHHDISCPAALNGVAQASRNEALRLLADLFAESAHETWTKNEIVNIIEDAITMGSPLPSTGCETQPPRCANFPGCGCKNGCIDGWGCAIPSPHHRIPGEQHILWLIEHPDNGKRSPFYFGWEEGEKGWTADINAAFKFEAAADAEKMASDCGLPDYKIVDHKWLDHKPASNLDVA